MAAGTVLVVDDDCSARRGLERLLRSAGFEVETFDSVSTFCGAPLPSGPACLVLDATMPGTSRERVSRLGKRTGPTLPVIFVTASDEPAAKEMARSIGAVGFFHKPVDGPALLDAIAWALEPRDGEDKRGQGHEEQ
jgi:FixJ family two-component response regulator